MEVTRKLYACTRLRGISFQDIKINIKSWKRNFDWLIRYWAYLFVYEPRRRSLFEVGTKFKRRMGGDAIGQIINNESFSTNQYSLRDDRYGKKRNFEFSIEIMICSLFGNNNRYAANWRKIFTPLLSKWFVKSTRDGKRRINV